MDFKPFYNFGDWYLFHFDLKFSPCTTGL
ncbi:hypothetical protein ACWA1C_09150 [Flectobacillus roseus]